MTCNRSPLCQCQPEAHFSFTRNTSTGRTQFGPMDEDQRLSSRIQDSESSMRASAAPAPTSGSAARSDDAIAGGNASAPRSRNTGPDSIMTDAAMDDEAAPMAQASEPPVVEQSAAPGTGTDANPGTSEAQATQAASAAASTTKKADANLKVWKPFSGMPPRIRRCCCCCCSPHRRAGRPGVHG